MLSIFYRLNIKCSIKYVTHDVFVGIAEDDLIVGNPAGFTEAKEQSCLDALLETTNDPHETNSGTFREF